MSRLKSALAILLLPLMLASCIVSPGKFTSTLDIRADRSFTFTYVGELIAMNDKDLMPSGGNEAAPEEQSWDEDATAQPAMIKIAADGKLNDKNAGDFSDPADSQTQEEKMQALVKALSQEYGYRSVRYLGKNKLAVDYSISGKLDRTFTFPFNVDAEIVLPFLTIELRGKDRIRVKAPAFGNERSGGDGLGAMGGTGKSASDEMDGTFTITTNAEIVSQNQEEGATSLPNGSRQISWHASPALKSAPMAVLKVSPLP